MLDKLKRLIGGEAPAPSKPSLNDLPQVDGGMSAPTTAPVVDTGRAAPEGVVTRILGVETHGEQTDVARLPQRFLGRQPVLDRGQQVAGYELMLRNETEREHDETLRPLYDEMLLKCVVELGVDRLLGGKRLFIELSADALDHPLLARVPSKGVVVCVHVGAAADVPALAAKLKELRARGYLLALDDYVHDAALLPLLRQVQFVRVRVPRFDGIELGKQAVAVLKAVASVELIATDVETEEDFEACRKLAFHYYQGRFFARPVLQAGQKVDSDRALVMNILNQVMAHAEISDLEKGFKHDPMLSFKLLRYINSAGNSLGQEVRSIAHALFILGYERLYRWLTLLLFVSGRMDERSRALMKSALVRARLTETLGTMKLAPAEREPLFIVGMFSLLDALLHMPMEKILLHLKLPDQVAMALLSGEGPYAPYLQLAIACEDFDQQRIERLATACGLDANTVNVAHVQALVWAEEVEQ
jgi:EAL and modified HD-GYP domain-containing signal transduction protein